jgi:hypothetical protein
MSIFAPSVNRYFKFTNVGDAVEGRIVDVGEPRQSYKYDPRPNAPRQLDFYDSGKPKMEVAITLQTELRDPEDADDDGQRKIIVPVYFKEQSQLTAIREAVRLAGAKELDNGGWLGVAFVGYDPESQNPQNPRKLYQALYRPPAGGGGVFSQGQDQQQPAQPQQQQPAQATPQWQQQPQQPAPAQQQPRTAQDYIQAAANGSHQPQQPAQQWQQPQPAQQPQQDPWQPQPAQLSTQQWQQPSQPQPQTWQQPQAAPQQQSTIDGDQVRALASQGFSDDDIAAATGASPEAIRTLRGIQG